VATSLDDLIRSADLDGLVRHVDDTCASREWDHLVRIRNEARSAVNTGRQLWPIATLANYRLALWAPAEFAVRALDDTARTFMPGPVSEILAVHHSWEDMNEHLAPGHDRSLVAYERALRGDEIDENEPAVLDLAINPQWWEPLYSLAIYTDDGVQFDSVDTAATNVILTAAHAEAISDNTVDVFRRMMEPWTAQSNGTAHAAVVEGGVEEALGALGLSSAGITDITHLEALQLLGWAASSGGAHGKRRGAATGRSEAWWLLATFTGLDEDWPCDAEELGEVIETLNFSVFRNEEVPTTGWGLNMIIEDPEEGLTVALSATDHA
jgi:hypothetical protein